jgi:hypothetical protein
VNADIAAAAVAVAAAENRTVTEQVNYWAGLGMLLERSASAPGRQMLAAVSGEAQFSTLSAEERLHAHALIDGRIAERVAKQRFGPTARKAGQVTVSVDEDGHLIEITPGGGRRRL